MIPSHRSCGPKCPPDHPSRLPIPGRTENFVGGGVGEGSLHSLTRIHPVLTTYTVPGPSSPADSGGPTPWHMTGTPQKPVGSLTSCKIRGGRPSRLLRSPRSPLQRSSRGSQCTFLTLRLGACGGRAGTGVVPPQPIAIVPILQVRIKALRYLSTVPQILRDRIEI